MDFMQIILGTYLLEFIGALFRYIYLFKYERFNGNK